MRQPMSAILLFLGAFAVLVGGCGWQPEGAPPPSTDDPCSQDEGPTSKTVHDAIESVPVVTRGSQWVEAKRGHTQDCRLYWVQIALSDATASSPEQLLFFDHNEPLGTPTPNPKPYTTVMTSNRSTVTVQYQWLVGDEPNCCPTGIGTTRYRIASDGELQAVDPIPNQ